jgi:putative heme degradation protein
MNPLATYQLGSQIVYSFSNGEELMDWQEIVEKFEQEAKSAQEAARYYGAEDAGDAFASQAYNAKVIARMAQMMVGTNTPVPSWLQGNRIEFAPNITIYEGVWGWRVYPKPDGYWDGNTYYSLIRTYATKEEALDAAQKMIATLEDVKQREIDRAAANRANAASTPLVKMTVEKTSWRDLFRLRR